MAYRTPARQLLAAIAGCAMLALAGQAQAEDIVVSNYGVSANGMPFAVAEAKGFFKQEGANVTGILSSAGGGTTLRNMLAGSAPYAEVNPNAVIAAIQQGADIKIISGNVLTVAEFVWAVKQDSPIRTVADLRGRKVGYTNPRSTSQALATMVLATAGLRTEDATLVKTGGFGEGVAALETGIVDCAPVPEPLWANSKGKYRAIARASEILPPLANVVGVSISNPKPEQAAFISAVIRARRRAVDYMVQHPEESGAIIAKVYNISPEVATQAVKALTTSRTAGVEYWGPGDIRLDGLRRAIEVQRSVGAISGDVDAEKIVDSRFLPEDLRTVR